MQSMTGIYAWKPFQIAIWIQGNQLGARKNMKGYPDCSCLTKEAIVKLSLRICLLIASQSTFTDKRL